MDEGTSPAWAMWFVGLPGSGKTTYARAVHEALRSAGNDVVYLSMDEKRKDYFPRPEYSSQERVEAYRLFAEEAARVAG